jgi:hypothetical protein
MSLRFRRLKLKSETKAGPYGAELTFEDGLNILWANNTKGKSTCLQGLLYALGLERMLSPRRQIPLTYVMTSHLDDPDTGERHDVLESSVWVEMANDAGEIITVRRYVVSPSGTDNKLVTVFEGPLLSNPGETYPQSDYFVLDPGAAQREAGFHKMLSNFMGWELPTVRRYDGGQAPLYLETIFPLLYVEQKAGWSSLPAAFPSYLQIRDVGKRALEFILGLETHELELRRQQIELDLKLNATTWSNKCEEVQTIVQSINARVEGLPATPTLATDEIERISLLIAEEDKWLSLEQFASELRDRIEQISQTVVPNVEELSPVTAAELNRLAGVVDEQNARQNALFKARQMEISQITSIGRRLRALDEDLQKNKDAQKLKNLGSTLTATFSRDHCPTCTQPIADTLLAQQATAQVMPIEDNIEYIKAQCNMFRRMNAQAESTVSELDKQLMAAKAAALESSAKLRALRADLVAPSNSPSIAVLEDRLRMEARLQALEDAQQKLEHQKSSLAEIALQQAELLQEKANLPEDRFTAADRQKLAKLSKLIREQANSYGFTTFPAQDIEISDETYRPQKEGFEIGFELSASDAIRLKWAYQIALLELERSEQTNHPGFVVFDEPRQQETAKLSFHHLLKRAASAKAAGQQVIFATSEDREQLERFLTDIECNLLAFEGPIVRRM